MFHVRHNAQQLPADQAALFAKEVGFAKEALSAGCRADSRQFHQLREVEFEHPFPNACMVSLGNTKAIATVRCELVEPLAFQPRAGIVEFFVRSILVDVGGTGVAASRQAVTGRDPQHVAIVRVLETIVKQGKLLDPESLCVVIGASVWSVRVDVTILCDDGNVMDAVAWAAIGALHVARRLEVSVSGERARLHPERDPVPLSLHHLAFPITAVVVADNDVVLDPTTAEREAGSATVVVAVSDVGQVCYVRNMDGAAIRYTVVERCIAAAKLLAPQLAQMLKTSTDAFHAARKSAINAQFKWAQTRTGVKSTVSNDSGTVAKKPRTE